MYNHLIIFICILKTNLGGQSCNYQNITSSKAKIINVIQTDNIENKDDVFEETGASIKQNGRASLEFDFMSTVNVVRVYVVSTSSIEFKATVEKDSVELVSLNL